MQRFGCIPALFSGPGPPAYRPSQSPLSTPPGCHPFPGRRDTAPHPRSQWSAPRTAPPSPHPDGPRSSSAPCLQSAGRPPFSAASPGSPPAPKRPCQWLPPPESGRKRPPPPGAGTRSSPRRGRGRSLGNSQRKAPPESNYPLHSKGTGPGSDPLSSPDNPTGSPCAVLLSRVSSSCSLPSEGFVGNSIIPLMIPRFKRSIPLRRHIG